MNKSDPAYRVLDLKTLWCIALGIQQPSLLERELLKQEPNQRRFEQVLEALRAEYRTGREAP